MTGPTHLRHITQVKHVSAYMYVCMCGLIVRARVAMARHRATVAQCAETFVCVYVNACSSHGWPNACKTHEPKYAYAYKYIRTCTRTHTCTECVDMCDTRSTYVHTYKTQGKNTACLALRRSACYGIILNGRQNYSVSTYMY